MKPETHAERRARVAEEDALNYECNRLFPLAGLRNPAVSIEAAFIVCKRIAHIIETEPTLNTPAEHVSYICLAQASPGTWAASFNLHAFDDPEWYEAVEIEALPYSARADTPQLAIARAAAKCVPLLLPLLNSQK